MMAKRKSKNKEVKTKVVEPSSSVPDLIIEKPRVSKYFVELNEKIIHIKEELNEKSIIKSDVENYLNENHKLYENIKENAFKIQKKILDYSKADVDVENKSEYVFFDFENNIFLSNIVKMMPECYLGDSGNIHLCKKNGLYINKEQYTSSRLFLADKKQIDKNLNFITSFEKILDSIVSNVGLDNKYSYFCMLPESIDLFNTKIRRCLNTSKGKIISIPKSIAITYYFLDKLNYGDRYCVVDLDGLHPVATQLSIGKDKKGNKVILREGFIKNTNIKYTYLKFASEYISQYERKYAISFSENEKKFLIDNKNISRVFNNKETLSLFRSEGRLDVIFDNEIYSNCIKIYYTRDCSFPNCIRTYVVSTQLGVVSGDTVIQVNSLSSFEGLKLIREKLLKDENAIIWKEKLPKVSLEVIDDLTHRFKVVDLIDENNEGQNIRLSIDEEMELPFKGVIILQQGKKDYYLPLEREIYSEDVNSAKEAHFTDKSFPLDRDIPVELVVKYNYMSESPIKLYARPKEKIDEFKELPNTWVDPHEIEVYSGPIYNEHPREIQKLNSYQKYIFSNMCRNIDNFIRCNTRFDDTVWDSDPTGAIYHIDYRGLVNGYRQIRALFDSQNIKDKTFEELYDSYKVEDFFEKYVELLDKVNVSIYDKKDIKKYLNGLSRPVSDFVVACWYYDKENESIQTIYKYLATQKDNIDVLCRLSRCIICSQDDIYGVFDNLSNQVYEEILKSKKKGIGFATKHNNLAQHVRSLSANCWFNKDWIYNFYNSIKGKECINEIINFTYDFLVGGDYGTSKKFRDILEFLVCISRLKDLNHDILNPNDPKTKKMLNILKNSYAIFEQTLGDKNLASRLITNANQGPLSGYPNYIYMLIITLSGEGQVDLVGYHDE